jgi:hypothetical protein
MIIGVATGRPVYRANAAIYQTDLGEAELKRIFEQQINRRNERLNSVIEKMQEAGRHEWREDKKGLGDLLPRWPVGLQDSAQGFVSV